MLTINDIIKFENVYGKLGEDCYMYFLIDDVARELGFSFIEEYKDRVIENLGANCDTQIEKYYTNEKIRWQRINNYLAQYNKIMSYFLYYTKQFIKLKY